MALNYFGRYIYHIQSGGERLTPDKLQRIAITSIFIALKIHSMGEEGLAEARARALSRLAHGHYEGDEVLDMEKDMLQVLDWRINPPTMHQFAIGYSQMHPLGRRSVNLTDYLYEITRYQMELSIFFPQLMMNYQPSVLAFAAMLRAEEEVDPRILTAKMRENFFSLQTILGMDPCHVNEARSALENLIPQVPNVAEFETFKVGEPNPSWPAQGRRDGAGGSSSPTGVAQL